MIQKDVNTDFWEAGGLQQEKGFRRAQLTVVLLSEQCFHY